MDVREYTRGGARTSLQISVLGNIPAGDFVLGQLFLIKNITADNLEVTVIMPDDTEIKTTVYPGWNPEIVK